MFGGSEQFRKRLVKWVRQNAIHLLMFLLWETAYGGSFRWLEASLGPPARILGAIGVMYLAFFSGWTVGVISFLAFLVFHVWLHSFWEIEWIQGIGGPALGAFGAIVFGLLGRAHRKAKEADRRLREALEVLDNQSSFLSRASHHLRTPLNAIAGNAQLLLQDRNLEDASDGVEQIHEAAAQLEGLISNVLELARFQSGKLSLSEQPLRLEEILQQSLIPAKLTAARKGLSLQLEIDPKLPDRVLVDREALLKTLQNLLQNAVAFSSFGTVTLAVTREYSSMGSGTLGVLFEVRDQGAGIDESCLDTIFHPYVQILGESARSHCGVGLGLPIAKELVYGMGGKLQVESRLGMGSRFFFSLQLCEAEESADQTEETSLARSPVPGLAWIAEDNPLNQMIFEKMLASFNWRTHSFSDGQELLDAIDQDGSELPDVFLLDGLMPRMGGIEVARHIVDRGDDVSRIKRILVTADVELLRSVGQMKEAETLFFDRILKPIDHAQLGRIMSEVESRAGLNQNRTRGKTEPVS